jgi:hypothetical protein
MVLQGLRCGHVLEHGGPTGGTHCSMPVRYDEVSAYSVSMNDDLAMMPSSRKAPGRYTLHWTSDM